MIFIRNKKNNEFGDKNYQMKDMYDANYLVVANLGRASSEFFECGPMIEITDQKYIFESFLDGEKIKYREIFTGFIASDKEEFFMLPYVVNPEPFVGYFPNTMGEKIPKLSLIWALNDINYPKTICKSKQLKK